MNLFSLMQSINELDDEDLRNEQVRGGKDGEEVKEKRKLPFFLPFLTFFIIRRCRLLTVTGGLQGSGGGVMDGRASCIRGPMWTFHLSQAAYQDSENWKGRGQANLRPGKEMPRQRRCGKEEQKTRWRERGWRMRSLEETLIGRDYMFCPLSSYKHERITLI